MPSTYEIALMLVRLLAATNITVGLAGLTGALVIALLETLNKLTVSPLEGVSGYLIDYGIVAMVGGLALMALSKMIARYASKG